MDWATFAVNAHTVPKMSPEHLYVQISPCVLTDLHTPRKQLIQ